MKNLQFERNSGPLEESVIEGYESLIGATLPPAYRRFLLETNGGPPSSKNNCFPILDNPEFIPEFNAAWVDRFYQLRGVARPALSLTQVYEMTRGRVPPDTIPIATDSQGNLFLLGVSGDIRDMVFLWDHETEGFEPPEDPFHNVCRLCDSFESFVDSLVEEDTIIPEQG